MFLLGSRRDAVRPSLQAVLPLQITWQELFGSAVSAGRNPTDAIYVSVDNLRTETADFSTQMNMIPAVRTSHMAKGMSLELCLLTSW